MSTLCGGPVAGTQDGDCSAGTFAAAGDIVLAGSVLYVLDAGASGVRAIDLTKGAYSPGNHRRFHCFLERVRDLSHASPFVFW